MTPLEAQLHYALSLTTKLLDQRANARPEKQTRCYCGAMDGVGVCEMHVLQRAHRALDSFENECEYEEEKAS